MFAILLTFFNASNAMAAPIDLSVSIINPDGGQSEEHREGPIFIPKANLDGSTLSFVTPCDGYELRLLDENGDVVYSIVIPVGTTSLVLPSYLSGDYEIQIIRGYICFWGHVIL